MQRGADRARDGLPWVGTAGPFPERIGVRPPALTAPEMRTGSYTRLPRTRGAACDGSDRTKR